MANEFKHKSVSTDLSQAEWDDTAGHVFNSQATGDLMYASSSTQLTRLAIGAANTILYVNSTVPGWYTNVTLTANGIEAANAAGPAIYNEAATSTNPTLLPNKADPDTGVGWVGTNNLAIIANGAKVIDATDGRVQFGNNAAGPQAMNETADWDNPTLIPNRADTDTGIGWASTNNMTLVGGGTGLVYVNGATGSLGFGVAASANYKHRFGGSFTAAADPRGILFAVNLTAPAGSSAIRHMYLSGSLTTQAASETLSRASGLEIEPLDLTIGSGSRVNLATTVYIGGAPTEGIDSSGNPNNYALVSDAGSNRFDGRILGNTADIASGTNIVLPSTGGNVYELTGTTKVDLISNLGWTEGSTVVLVANESVTIDDGTSTSSTNITISLKAGGDYGMTAGDTLTLALVSTTAGGQMWTELSRVVKA